VVYGGGTTLTGTIAPQKSGEKVTVFAQACGAQSFTPAGNVSTTTAGAWTLASKPLRTTVYQAKVRNATSPQVSVKVAPAVRLSHPARTRFSVRVSAADSFAGKVAVFQRYVASTGKWVRVKYLTLRALGGTSPTFVSGTSFRSRVAVGTRVRVALGQAMVGACYAAAASNAVRS
jgi:hypothetical protein